MKVLFVCPSVPWPLVTGGKIRTFNLIKEASAHAEIHLRIIREPEEIPEAEEALAPWCGSVRFFDRSRPGTIRRWMLPKLERWFHSTNLHAHVKGELSGGDFKLVHLDELLLARIVPSGRKVPVIQHHHKLDTVLYDTLSTGEGPQRHFDLWKLRRLEAESARRYRHHLFCSHEDAEILRSRYGALDVAVVPSGFDPGHFAAPDSGSGPRTTRDPNLVLFLGSMNYGPNVDGIVRFCQEALPLLRARRPEMRLEIVGREPTPEVEALAADDVNVVGEVPDVRPYLERASVLIVPLQIGGGTRLKIVEALAVGTPVVSTTIGAEGLGLVDRRDIVLADTNESFADATAELLEAPDLAAQLGHDGCELVHQRFRWSVLAEELVDYWERVAFSGALSPSR